MISHKTLPKVFITIVALVLLIILLWEIEKESMVKISESEGELIGTWEKGLFFPPVWGIRITFHENHKFDYSYFDDMVKHETKGSWALSQNRVVLKPDKFAPEFQRLHTNDEWLFENGKLHPNKLQNGEYNKGFFLTKKLSD